MRRASTNAVKAAETAAGFNVVMLRGSQNRDGSRRRVFRATTLAASSVASVAGNNIAAHGAETYLQHWPCRGRTINRDG